jgi:hypothetical protein
MQTYVVSLSAEVPVTFSCCRTIVTDVSSVAVFLSHSVEITHVAGCNASCRNLSAPTRNLQKMLKTPMLISLLKYV